MRQILIKARPYQLECVEAIRARLRTHPTALVQLPTASGKSVTASELIRQLRQVKPDFKSLIVVPKVSIVRSFVKDLQSIGGSSFKPTIACASSNSPIDLTGQIVVGSFQTLVTRKLPAFDLAILDECHRVDWAKPKSQYAKLALSLPPTTKILGLTATPYRETGYIYGDGKLFPEVTFARTLQWTTEMGFTVPAVAYSRRASFDTSKLKTDNTGDYMKKQLTTLSQDEAKAAEQVIDILSQTEDRNKVAIACVTIEHCEMVASLIRSHGHLCAVVHSDQLLGDKDLSLGEFENNPKVRYLTFVSILSEGYNYPPTDAIVLLRPTKSPTLMVQIVGRGLRVSDGKHDCLVLDYGNVIKNCGPIDKPYVRDSRDKKKTTESFDEQPIVCLHCDHIYFVKQGDTQECPECGAMAPEERDPYKHLKKKADHEIQLYSTGKTITKPKAEILTFLCSSVGSLTLHGKGLYILKLTTTTNRELTFFQQDPGEIDVEELQWSERWKYNAARDSWPAFGRLVHDAFGIDVELFEGKFYDRILKQSLTVKAKILLTKSTYVSHEPSPHIAIELPTRQEPTDNYDWINTALRVFPDTKVTYNSYGGDRGEGST